eukprot:g6132.t1
MVDSPFIVHLHASYRDALFVYMLIEAAEGGCLEDVICASRSARGSSMRRWAQDADVMFYLACIIEGLGHLHERKIAHRDLKPGNVLLDDRGYAKICDLGFARFVLKKTYTFLGTPEPSLSGFKLLSYGAPGKDMYTASQSKEYMAPEILDFPHEHDEKVDWWALGVLTFELLSGQTPWLGGDNLANAPFTVRRGQQAKPLPQRDLPAETWMRRMQRQGRPACLLRPLLRFACHFAFRFQTPEDTPQAAIAFTIGLLSPSSDKRLGSFGSSQVRQHRWFQEEEFEFEALRNGTLLPPHQKYERRSSKSVTETRMMGLQAPPPPVTAEEHLVQLDSHDSDEVFKPIPEEEFFWTNVVMVDGEISKSDGKNRCYDGYSTSMMDTVVRIACAPKTLTGGACFGLTREATDDHSFPNGFWIGMSATLASGSCLFKEGEVVHNFGRVEKTSLFGKVFLSNVGDTADFCCYMEVPDDGSRWDDAFAA